MSSHLTSQSSVQPSIQLSLTLNPPQPRPGRPGVWIGFVQTPVSVTDLGEAYSPTDAVELARLNERCCPALSDQRCYSARRGDLPAPDLDQRNAAVERFAFSYDMQQQIDTYYAEKGWTKTRISTKPRRRRRQNQRGSYNHNSILTEIDVAAIKADLRTGDVAHVVAERFGVSESAVEHIAAGRSWRHVA